MRGVVVTGCSSGIGRACALELARAGYKTFAGVRNDDDASSLRSNDQPGLIPVRLDVRDAESIEEAVGSISSALGDSALFGLVNNAGVSAWGPLEFLELSEIQAVLDVNLLGPVRMVQALLPKLRQSSGRIINIGSGEAFLATAINSAYCMSKHALEAFSDSLRMELAPLGVRVVLVEPGGTKTRIFEKEMERLENLRASISPVALDLYGESLDARARMPERGRSHLLRPEAVARAVRAALDARRPRARYFVGADVRGAFLLGRLVPAVARDQVLRMLFGFPRRKAAGG